MRIAFNSQAAIASSLGQKSSNFNTCSKVRAHTPQRMMSVGANHMADTAFVTYQFNDAQVQATQGPLRPSPQEI